MPYVYIKCMCVLKQYSFSISSIFLGCFEPLESNKQQTSNEIVKWYAKVSLESRHRNISMSHMNENESKSAVGIAEELEPLIVHLIQNH